MKGMTTLWKTEVTRGFPKWGSGKYNGPDDQVGERLREYVITHIQGFANEETSPELTKYSRMLESRTPMKVEMFIDLRVLLKAFHLFLLAAF